MKNRTQQLLSFALISTLAFAGLASAADAPAAAGTPAPAPAAAPKGDPKLAAAQTKIAESYRAEAEKIKTQNEKNPAPVRATAEVISAKWKAGADLYDKAAAAYTSGDAAAIKLCVDAATQATTTISMIGNAPSNRLAQVQNESEESFTVWQNQYPLAIDLLKVFIAARKTAAEKYRLLADIQCASAFDREAYYKALDAAKQAGGDLEVAQINWIRMGRIRHQTELMKKVNLSPAKMEITAEAERVCKELVDMLKARNDNATKMQQLTRDVNRLLVGDIPPKK